MQSGSKHCSCSGRVVRDTSLVSINVEQYILELEDTIVDKVPAQWNGFTCLSNLPGIGTPGKELCKIALSYIADSFFFNCRTCLEA
jgi:hypothetical protein